ncbi:hypothetical protein NPIL_611701, partial [Nephila pilipes]
GESGRSPHLGKTAEQLTSFAKITLCCRQHKAAPQFNPKVGLPHLACSA